MNVSARAASAPARWRQSRSRWRRHPCGLVDEDLRNSLPNDGLVIQGIKRNSISERYLGPTRGIRTSSNFVPNEINCLRGKRVGCQHLLLRHLALGQSSLLEFRAPKIPSICRLPREMLLTAGMAGRSILVSLCPIFSEPHDCAEKVRRR